MIKTDNKRLLDAIKKVGEELSSLSVEGFQKDLQCHKDSDITKMLLETNALCLIHEHPR